LAAVLASLNEPLAARLSDRGLAITQLPTFEGHYHGLATSIEAASDQIEAVAETARISV
jgi:hypothetical protein